MIRDILGCPFLMEKWNVENVFILFAVRASTNMEADGVMHIGEREDV